MIPVTYCYAQVSKADDATRNLETPLRILQWYNIRERQRETRPLTESLLNNRLGQFQANGEDCQESGWSNQDRR